MIDYTVDATRLQASLAGGGGDLSSNTGSSEIVALGEEVEPLESWDGIFGEYGLDTMAPSGYAGALDVAHDAASPGQSPSQLCLSKYTFSSCVANFCSFVFFWGEVISGNHYCILLYLLR